MIVRPLRHEDIDRLIEMGRHMHAESAFAFLPYEPEKVRRLAAEIIARPDTYCGLAADNDGVLVGMLGGYLTDYFFCHEKLACDLVVYVEPDHRGSRAAAQLIKAFCRWAAARGAREVCLGASTNIDRAGIDVLYRRLGFTPVGGLYKLRL